METRTVLAVVSDLFFSVKITEAAKRAGVSLQYATNEKDVLDWCRDKMAGYKRPRGVSFMAESEMPRTATGKIQHRILRDMLSKAKA